MNKIEFLNAFQKQQLLEKPNEIWNFVHRYKLQPSYITSKKEKITVESIIGHSEEALHIIVKSSQTNLTNRDRAYQHGDGFHFVLAIPKENNEKTDEFYVIGMSPLATNWMKKFIWYKNVDLAMVPLNKTEIKTISFSDSTYFVVTIPFEEIPPIKGCIQKQIGFNLSYVQALKEGINIYILKEDDRIQSEQSLRDYIVFQFDEPKDLKTAFYQTRLSTLHSKKGFNPFLECGIYSPISNIIKLEIEDSEKYICHTYIQVDEGFSRHKIPVNVSDLKLGSHPLTIKIYGKILEQVEFYLYDEKEFEQLKNKINQIQTNKNPYLLESISTLIFDYEYLLNKLKQLKPYESFQTIVQLKEELKQKMSLVESGQHLLQKGEAIRLAFLSQYDQTFQPYTLYIPKNINIYKNPKLLVLLHGSGSDDTSIKYNPFHFNLAEEQNMIILAPNARGTSHFYCPKEAILEVIEITKKIGNLFTIDENQIYLGGFSMGGYGVYRVFDEAPDLYKGLIVISGHPSLGKKHNGIDYTDPIHMTRFKDIRLIVFHGTEDRNCRYHEVKSFTDRLTHLNPHCEVHYKEGIGHSGLIEEWYELLSQWFKQF